MSSASGLAVVFLLIFAIVGFLLVSRNKIFLFLQISAVFIALILFQAGKASSDALFAEILAIIFGGSLGALVGRFRYELKLLKETIFIQKEQLRSKTEQLHDFQLNIIKHDELERRALAGDLHDQILNDLKDIKDNLGKVPESFLTEKIDLASRNIREVMDSLSPTVLESLGLLASIEDCLRKGAEETQYKLRVKFLVDKSAFDKYSLIEQTLIYRIVQEVKNNICRHAKASKVRISAREENAQIKIIIEDDGIGIKSGDSSENNTSRGLLYMKQRASIIGASVHWRPGIDNKGCVVEIFLPEKK